MAYHKPSFKINKYDKWSFYNDKCGYFQEDNNINFMISHVLKLNRIYLFLIYVSFSEFEVPKKLEIKSNIINPSNSLTCNHFGKIYKQMVRINIIHINYY